MNEAITSLAGGRASELLAMAILFQAAFKDLDISDPTTLFSYLKDLGFLADPWAKLAETVVPREPKKLLASSR